MTVGPNLSLLCISLLGATTLAAVGSACTGDSSGDAQPQDAQAVVLDAFDTYQIVGGFNASHGNKDVDDFLLDLIRNPELPRVVDDIAIECGNALHQDVLDRYIAGRDVPLTEIQKVWRDTSQQAICGFSTFYEQLIPLVRRINADLPDDQKLRVLACDPPIDWTKVSSRKDMESFGGRDENIAAVIEREVLAKERKALMLFGIHHMQHIDGTAVGRYEANGHRGVTYVIGEHNGFANGSSLSEDNDELEARMADWPRPSIVAIEGSWLEELDSAYFNEPPGEKGYPGVDAYLYVGPRDTLLREPRSAQAILDDEYIAELEQRAASIGQPPDGPGTPRRAFQLESEASVFSYNRQKAVPGGVGETPNAQEQEELEAALKYSACMRAHGLPTFPDPKLSSDGGIETDLRGAGINPDSQQFKAAAQACKD